MFYYFAAFVKREHVAYEHVAVARSATPNGAAPVTGNFIGAPASTLEAEVIVVPQA